MYAKVIKKCARYAREESLQITTGSTVLYTSPAFEDDKEKTLNVCLPSTHNNQYTLILKDSISDSWSDGSYVTIEGEYGNVVIKTFMTEMKTEEVPLSLYTPVKKTDTWKKATAAASGWTDFAFEDGSWIEYVSTTELTLSGAMYFRKTFMGLNNMAAMEVRVQYQFGVIAYINGLEVFRDNMPSGAAAPTTMATGSYDSLSYHGVIRSAARAQNAESVLAVELHPLEGGETTSFEAFLALYASSFKSSKCYIVPDVPVITATSGTNTDKVIDFNKGGSAYVSYIRPLSILFDFSALGSYAVNGVRFFPSSAVTSTPNTFVIEGSNQSAEGFETMFEAAGWKFSYKTPKYDAAVSDPEVHKFYRLTVTNAQSSETRIYEMQLLVCNRAVPTAIEYPMPAYEFLAVYQTVSVEPTSLEFANCTVSPALPAGLSLTATCGITGEAQAASPATSYVISTPMYGGISGTVTLTITECAGTMLRMKRTYASYSTYEKFTVKDQTTGNDLLVVDYATSQQDKTDVFYPLCAPSALISVVTESTEKFWKKGSFLLVQSYITVDSFDTIAFIRYDSNLALPTTTVLSVASPIKAGSSWYYKMGEVSASWSGSSVAGWSEAAPGSFPASTNQVQLYKKTFTVASLEGLSGFVFAVKYKAGCIVVINDHEVFRKGVAGELTSSSLPTESYSSVAFREVTIPVSANGVEFLREGANTIAVAIVTMTGDTASSFDCFARFITPETSRVYEYTMTQYGISGTNGEPFSRFFSQYFSGLTSNNWIQLQLDGDRREWINSLDVQAYYLKLGTPAREFVFIAKNPEDSEWTTLANVTGLTWSSPGQHRKLWIQATKPYSMFRWTNFGTGRTDKTNWELQALDLTLEKVPATIPALTYESVSVYRDIEMAEVYPSSTLYYDFSTSPQLPASLVIDPYTGVISGVPRALQPATTYTIHAKDLNAAAAQSTITITVDKCTGGKGLMTVAWMTDTFANENSYAIYEGRGTEGVVKQQAPFVPVSSGLFYVDVCYPHGIYTFQGLDSVGDGWSAGTGYRLTVDQGSFPVDMRELPKMPKPASVTTVFSTFFPFQVEFDQWSVLKEGAPAAGWNTADFAESWTEMYPAELGTAQQTTIYLRKTFAIPSLDDYSVLNVRAQFAGGCVAYFNGRLVARFFLPATFDATTGGEYHDVGFYMFHVILAHNGATESANVVAFELHRTAGTSTADPFVFDATGVFGVEDCSPVVDTMVDTASANVDGELANLFDYQAFTSVSFLNEPDAFAQWTVANRAGSSFSQFGYYPQSSPVWGYSLYARMDEEDEWNNVSETISITATGRQFMAHDVAIGFIGYRQFKFVVESVPESSALLNAFLFRYCKATGAVCPGVDEFPPVAEGQISPAVCPYGMTGYLYRECVDGALSDVHSDKCVHKLPLNLTYGVEAITLVKDTEMEPLTPRFVNLITSFNLTEEGPLPAGLNLDPITGVISGIPTVMVEEAVIEVVGENPTGIVSTRFTIRVRKGSCKADDKWSTTPVGEEATYECSMKGSYVGTQKRTCLLGKKDGEWQAETGMCVSVVLIVVVIVVVIVVIVVVVVLLIRHAASRAVTAATGRSATQPKKAKAETVKKTKAVKV